MDEHKDYFNNKELESPVPHWITTDGLKASIKSETKPINKDNLIESAANDIDDCVSVQHDCIDQSAFDDSKVKNSLGCMVDEWFDGRVVLFNKKSFEDSSNDDVNCNATGKENKNKLVCQKHLAQNSSLQHDINELCNQLLLFE